MRENPLGFGAADFIAFALAATLVAAAFISRPFLRDRFAALAENTRASMLVLATLPLALRILLLPTHPIPTPEIYDEFSHLLVADTLLHFRLANPPHALPQFFETFFVLQQPTYSSIYPPGQGLLLAFGRAISGFPWTGVLLATSALCALSYWMLRAWTTPRWALAGGLLAVIEFGPLNSWTNSYWGGALPAAAGCLAFGALPRLRQAFRRRDATLLGIGIGVCCITRPFESCLLLLSVALFFLPVLRNPQQVRRLAPAFAYSLMALSPFLLLIAAQNKQVTGQWTTLAEQLSQFQYGVPTTLTIQPPATPHHPLTPQQELDYKAQAITHGSSTDTLARFFLRLEYRIRYYRFFFLPPLYLALLAFLFTLRQPHMAWVVATLSIFALGTNLFPYLLPRYLAIVTCLFVLVSVVGLRRIGNQAADILLLLCFAHFTFWYGLHLLERVGLSSPVMQYETWDEISHDSSKGSADTATVLHGFLENSQTRKWVSQQIAAHPGKQLVFVRYWPQHRFQNEWVWNSADIDSSLIVMARDLGTLEDEKLLHYFPDRTAWLLEPDAAPPRLTPYVENNLPPAPNQPSTSPFTDVK